MSTRTDGSSTLPSSIVDAVKASMDNTYPAFFSEKPVPIPDESDKHDLPCIAGIISFVGNMSWSLSWIFTQETAPVLARRFSGFDIPFDSADMGDMVGELVNVIAGEVVSQMEQRNMKTQMSLPTVARGKPLELVPDLGPATVHLPYASREGVFWLRLAAAKHFASRLPGA